MSTNFPTSLDTLTNPTGTDSVATVDHAAQHSNANDAIEAIEAKVGADGSAVTSSHDYKLSEVTSTDKAVGKTATQTLTNKTLTNPTVTTGSFSSPALTTPSIAGSTGTGVNDYGGASSFEIPNSATPTVDADGEIALDTTVADFSHGIVKYFGGEEMAVIAVPVAELTSPTNGDVISYNSTTDEFQLVQLASGPSCTTSIPFPVIPFTSTDNPKQVSVNTTGLLYLFQLPFAMTVNKISIKTGNTVTTPGTFDLTIYSEDGQTREIAVTTASVSATGTIITTAVSSVVLNAGMHWFMINSNGTADANFAVYTDLAGSAFNNLTGNIGTDVASEPVVSGTITITAGTPPTTITPTSITEALLANSAIVFRLDN